MRIAHCAMSHGLGTLLPPEAVSHLPTIQPTNSLRNHAQIESQNGRRPIRAFTRRRMASPVTVFPRSTKT